MPQHLPRPEPVSRPGAELLALLGLPSPDQEPAWSVTGVALDSRAVVSGDLYAALPGLQTHGARFAPAALAGGAAAILTDEQGGQIIAEMLGEVAVPVLVVSEPRGRLGEISSWAYGRPAERLLLVGITGTNGKTTTSYLLDAALRAHGHRTGVIGTVAIQAGDEVLPSARTTPEAPDLHALLGYMAGSGVTAVTMEVSSHALSMGRVDGVRFDLVMFTNFSQDHLDYHGTLEEYFLAKAALFVPSRADAALVCTDDQWGRRLRAQCQLPVTTYGLIGSPDWRASDLSLRPGGGTGFQVWHGSQAVPAGVALSGTFNVANALGAVGAAAALGLPVAAAAAAVAACPGVPGRMEAVALGQPFLAIVDYAHTPDAVTRALAAARSASSNRVIAVLGCGGDRDRDKRPIMGQVAAAGCDILFVTDDNPRSESASSIRAAMIDGVMSVEPARRATVQEFGDRRVAIATAVAAAQPGDAVLVLGKGHEQGQEVAGVLHPFDDRVEVRQALVAWMQAQEGGPQ